MTLLEALYPLTEVSGLNRRYDDDCVDRLNSRYTMFIFIVLGIIISTRQYVGDSISCWAPAEFSHEWIEYTNKICWISNTYYVPMDEAIPNRDDNKDVKIAYYQWVPIVIFLQAILCLAPSMVWQTLNNQSGINVNKIVSVVTGKKHGGYGVGENTIKYIVKNLDRALRSQQEYRTGCFANLRQSIARNCFIICGKRYGNYLIMLYLFVKILYIANGIGQLFLLNAFLGDGYYLYGVEVVKDIAQGKNWTTSPRFPRVTLCDFDIRALGNRIHSYTVQCALPINLFNEKVYIFIWFWLVFISIATVLNFVLWMWTLFRRNRRQYVHKYLKIMHKNFAKDDCTPSKEFCEDYLRQDGIFVLRMIAKNTNDVVVGWIIQEMWEHYKKYHPQTSKKLSEDV
ncbi:innexin unc-9-like [Watersipora subatra]|uniref:innexin unc-9-like n=1 Tax=Watersipora subatra TaxID=2589382 RepID=UPI00355B0497